MLMRIHRRQVRIGMFVERLEGSWLDHPYWTERFLLSDVADVARLRDSKVSAVLIDVSKGVGPLEPEEKKKAPPHKRPVDRQIARMIERSQRLVADLFRDARLGQAIDVAATAAMVDEITDAVRRNPLAVLQMTRLKTKDACTYQHSVAVCALMVQFARYLGMDEETVRALGMGGLFHDIGKVTMPAHVLSKPARLSDDEMAMMRAHPVAGHAFLSRQAGIPDIVAEIALKHHERPDGSGYPSRLAAAEFGRAVRMASICDVYDAVTSVRPYKETWSSPQALANMLSWTGQFEELLLLQFAASLGTRLICNREVDEQADSVAA